MILIEFLGISKHDTQSCLNSNSVRQHVPGNLYNEILFYNHREDLIAANGDAPALIKITGPADEILATGITARLATAFESRDPHFLILPLD